MSEDYLATYPVVGQQNTRVVVSYDDMASSPREWDGNLGTMVCFHDKYDLGDKYNFEDIDDAFAFKNDVSDDGGVVLPLYLMDHSGLSISTEPFVGDIAHQDSGIVGFIYATREQIQTAYADLADTYALDLGSLWVRARSELKKEVATYDQYIAGTVYEIGVQEKVEYIAKDGSERALNRWEDKQDADGLYLYTHDVYLPDVGTFDQEVADVVSREFDLEISDNHGVSFSGSSARLLKKELSPTLAAQSNQAKEATQERPDPTEHNKIQERE